MDTAERLMEEDPIVEHAVRLAAEPSWAQFVECARGGAADFLSLVVEGHADLLEGLVGVNVREFCDCGGALRWIGADDALLD